MVMKHISAISQNSCEFEPEGVEFHFIKNINYEIFTLNKPGRMKEVFYFKLHHRMFIKSIMQAIKSDQANSTSQTGRCKTGSAFKDPVRQCLAPTFAILGLKTPSAFENTASTTSAAVMDAYFFLRSELPGEEKEPAPCNGSNTLLFFFLSCS